MTCSFDIMINNVSTSSCVKWQPIVMIGEKRTDNYIGNWSCLFTGSGADEEKQHRQGRRNGETTCDREETAPQNTEKRGQNPGSDV